MLLSSRECRQIRCTRCESSGDIAAKDVADVHQVVVDDVGEVIDGEAVRLEQHGVALAHVGRVERDFAVHHVLDAHY